MVRQVEASDIDTLWAEEVAGLARDEQEDRAAKIARMNKMANLLVEAGLSTDFRAYLLAMHGIRATDRQPSKSEAQKRYEGLESQFHHGRVRQVFARHDNGLDNGFSPIRTFYAFPRTLFDEFRRNIGQPGARPEFSAVRFRIEREYDDDDECIYIGKLLVPAFSVNALDVRKTAPDVRRVEYEILREARTDQEDVSSDVLTPVETLFGSDIANWVRGGPRSIKSKLYRILLEPKVCSELPWTTLLKPPSCYNKHKWKHSLRDE